MSKPRIKELENIVKALDTAFEVGDDCIDPISGEIVSDNEYDALKQELFDLSPKSKIFDGVTASTVKTSKDKIIHNPPMTSINKCNGSEEEKSSILLEWIKSTQKSLPLDKIPKDYSTHLKNNYCMSYKHDGLALSCVYEDGELQSVGLRSKSGIDGIDVTDKSKYIEGIHQTLSLPISCTIRGEVETLISVFEEVSESLGDNAKANCRAHCAGSMNQKTAEKMKDRGLRFTSYNIIGLEDPPYLTEIERAEWANDKLNLNFVKTIPLSLNMLKTFEDNHRRLDFMVDGVVISINNLEEQEACGRNGDKATGNSKGKLAFKFKDQTSRVIVTDIVWQTGRTGSSTPVLIFDGVSLEGTIVSRCTAHNLGFIIKHGIGIGSEIEIIKSGKIIPKVHKVITTSKEKNIPELCHSCSSELIIVDGQDGAESLVCNDMDCPAQNIKNLNHWMKTLGVKGIAGATIERLIDSGLVQKPGDFYRLTVKDLMDAGFRERTSTLIVSRSWMIRDPEQIKDNSILSKEIEKACCGRIKMPLWKFFAAFGLKSAGKEVGKILEAGIGNWEDIKTTSPEQFEKFEGIGPIMAKEIVKFFQDNTSVVEDVEQYFDLQVKASPTGKLSGKSFVLSGNLDGGKAKWQDAIEKQGGAIRGSVSKKIDYLVAGEGSVGKTKQADGYKITILTVSDLEEILQG